MTDNVKDGRFKFSSRS